jgi:hypothetical protein
MPDVRREPFERGREERQGREEGGMPIARHDLRGNGFRYQAERRQGSALQFRCQMRIRADGARDLPYRDLFSSSAKARSPALHFGQMPGESDAKRDGLRVHAMASTDHRRHAMLVGSPREGADEAVGALQQKVARAHEQQRKARVEDVTRSHSAVQPTRVGAGQLLHVRQECDDVVTNDALDLVDAITVEDELLVAQGFRDAARNELGLFHRRTRGELDFEPRPILRAVRPKVGERLRRIPRNHRRRRCERTLGASSGRADPCEGSPECLRRGARARQRQSLTESRTRGPDKLEKRWKTRAPGPECAAPRVAMVSSSANVRESHGERSSPARSHTGET